jgi:hypothetical protein
MNPIQKQCLGIGLGLIVAMLAFPPWTRKTQRVVMEISNRNLMLPMLQTESIDFAGYSLLWQPPPLSYPPRPEPIFTMGDRSDSVSIAFDILVLEWLATAALTAVAVVYFKGSDKKSLADWWASQPWTTTVHATMTHVDNQYGGTILAGIGTLAVLYLIGTSQAPKSTPQHPKADPGSQTESPREAANAASQASQAAAQFQNDFFERYPDLQEHKSVVDGVAARLQANGFKGESRDAVMEMYATVARAQLAGSKEAQPEIEGVQPQPTLPPEISQPENATDGLVARTVEFQKQHAAQGSESAQYELGLRYLKGDGVEKDEALARKWLTVASKNGYSPATRKLAELDALAGSKPNR